jgi:uncharacterized protein YecE (DUF72 family)
MKKLKEPARATERFLHNVRALGDRLGPILFQLPPRWKQNLDRLSGLLEVLPDDLRYVFEFRDTTWMTEDTLGELRRHGAAFCIYELEGYTSPLHLTAPFTYVRLHGPGAAYEGSYDDETLGAWAGWARGQEEAGIDVFIYFDNDQNAYAPSNARRLLELLSR